MADPLVKELWSKLTSNDLIRLQDTFSRNRFLQDGEGEEKILISKDEFMEAIADIFGSNEFDFAASSIFDAAVAITSTISSSTVPTLTPSVVSAFTAFKTSVTSSSSSTLSARESNLSLPQGVPCPALVEQEEKVSWSAILRQFLQFSNRLEEKEDESDTKELFDPLPNFIPLPYIRGEEICSLKTLKSSGEFVTIGSKGLTMILDPRFQLLRQNQIQLEDNVNLEDISMKNMKYKNKSWVTCSSMLGERILVLGNVSGILHFVTDGKSRGIYETLKIVSFPSIPSVLHVGKKEGEWWLAIGNDKGSVFLLKSKRSFETFVKEADRKGKLLWEDAFKKVGTFSVEKLHSESVSNINYNYEVDVLASCSRDNITSIVVTRPYASSENYKFSICKGVKTMAIEWNLHVLAAVSGDGLVKVWNPFVPSKPLLKIPPSYAHDPAVDIGFIASKALLVVLYYDSFVGIWSLESTIPIQTMKIKLSGGKEWISVHRPLIITSSDDILILGQHHVAIFTGKHKETSDFLSCLSGSHQSFLSASESLFSSGRTKYRSTKDSSIAAVSHLSYPNASDSEVADSSFDDTSKEKLQKMVRQGAPFCCLKLFEIKEPFLPKNLPIPKQFSALGLSMDDPQTLLNYAYSLSLKN